MTDEQRRNNGGRDDVGTLIRKVGRRPAVPADRAARVKATVHRHWRQEVHRRSRTRYVWYASALAAAATVTAGIFLWVLDVGPWGPGSVNLPVVVELLNGAAWSSPLKDAARQPKPLAAGEDILAASTISTGDNGLAALRLPSGHSVRLDSSTNLRIFESGALALDTGAVYIDSGMHHEEVTPLTVETTLGSVRETGTQFEVRLRPGSVRVRVREGSVTVMLDGGDHHLPVATELEVGRDGSLARREITTHGPEWDWTSGITPVIDLEGRTAREFLDWAVRERGWELAFADEQVERSAGETVLGGTVAGLTLEQTLEAVLPTCRMNHQVESGVLIIEGE